MVTVGEFAVTRCLFGISRIGVKRLQGAAAGGSFSETACSGMQSCQTLIQTKIVGSLWQGRHQRAQSLSRHVVRNKKLGIGERRAHSQLKRIRVMLMDGRSSTLEFVDDNGRFFCRNRWF